MTDTTPTLDRSTATLTSGLNNHSTLVLGADDKPMGYPITTLNAKETANILLLGRAEVITWSDRYILRGDREPFQLPSVIRLSRNLHNILADKPVAFTDYNLAVRDEATCQYTGKILTRDHPDPKRRATFDHVKPRAKGGTSTWDNAVLASAWANNLKGDMSVEEFEAKYGKKYGIKLIRKPWVPTPADMLSLAISQWRTTAYMPEDWKHFLESVEPTVRVQRIRDGKLYSRAA